MSAELRKQTKNDFEKDFSKVMNNSGFQKTMENVRKHRATTLATTEKRNYLVSKLNYYSKEFFTENLLATEISETEILMNNPVYLGLSMLD